MGHLRDLSTADGPGHPLLRESVYLESMLLRVELHVKASRRTGRS